VDVAEPMTCAGGLRWTPWMARRGLRITRFPPCRTARPAGSSAPYCRAAWV